MCFGISNTCDVRPTEEHGKYCAEEEILLTRAKLDRDSEAEQ